MTKTVEQIDPTNSYISGDLLIICHDPSGVPQTLVITVDRLFANIPVPIVANSVQANVLVLAGNTVAPGNSNVTGMRAGRLWMAADNYLYYSTNTSHTVRMGPFATF